MKCQFKVRNANQHRLMADYFAISASDFRDWHFFFGADYDLFHHFINLLNCGFGYQFLFLGGFIDTEKIKYILRIPQAFINNHF